MIFFIGGLLSGIGKIAGIASNPASLLVPNNTKDVLNIFDGDSKKQNKAEKNLKNQIKIN